MIKYGLIPILNRALLSFLVYFLLAARGRTAEQGSFARRLPNLCKSFHSVVYDWRETARSEIIPFEGVSIRLFFRSPAACLVRTCGFSSTASESRNAIG